MDEMLNTAQETSAAEGMEDTGFLEGLTGESFEPQESETEGEAQETSAADPSASNDDAAEEQTEEQTSEADAAKAGGDEPKVEPDSFLEVTFMGEKKQLTQQEAVTWAQKGMNYDRIESQVAQLREERARLEAELTAPRAENAVLPLLTAYAKAAGGDLKTLTDQMMQAVKQAGIAIEQPKPRNYMQERAVKDWEAFFKANPNIHDPKTELAPEVWQMIRAGVTPVNALIQHQQAELEKRIVERDARIKELEDQAAAREAAQKKNEENKKKAGSALKSSAQKVEDDFLSGFLG